MCSRLLRLPPPLLLALFLPHLSTVLADTAPYYNDQAYDHGDYGRYPDQSFHSSDINAPRLNILSKHSTCDDGSYLMLNPRGHAVHNGGPTILDSHGSLVWSVTGYKETYDLMVQEYQGQPYLTFWSGDDAIRGHGSGEYIMIDQAYKEAARIPAGNGMMADLHEFRLTESGTALITIYDKTPANLTSVGKQEDGWVWDGIFQEIDLSNGDVVYQWRATEHYSLTESFHGIGNQGSKEDPYDFFHINSVEKDPWGNYLISSRYMHTLTYINGSTSEIIWILGGKRNMFKDISKEPGAATSFQYQHDARWHDDYTTISIFDNGAQYDNNGENEPYSSGMKIRVDTEAMTAELIQRYVNPEQILSSSQGSTQVLPNGNVLVGYGYKGAFTEFSEDGKALCDYHLGPIDSGFPGDVQSYRVLKFNWTGKPDTRPSVAVVDGDAYVSWSGATEVHSWVVETSQYESEEVEDWSPMQVAEKKGFETRISLKMGLGPYIRITAVDKGGRSLRSSDVLKYEAAGIMEGLRLGGADTRPIIVLIVFVLGVTVVLSLGWIVNKSREGWRKYRYSKIALAEDV